MTLKQFKTWLKIYNLTIHRLPNSVNDETLRIIRFENNQMVLFDIESKDFKPVMKNIIDRIKECNDVKNINIHHSSPNESNGISDFSRVSDSSIGLFSTLSRSIHQ